MRPLVALARRTRCLRRQHSIAPIARPDLGTTPKTAEGARELYDNWAGEYDATLRSWEYPAPARAASLLRDHSNIEGTVLDAGCGTGLSGEALHALGFARIVGTDVSAESLKFCEEKNIYERVVVANLEEPLPFDDNSFSGIVCVGVLSYVQRFDLLFPEWCRVTRPGGVVVFTHRSVLWDEDDHGVRSSADATHVWKQKFLSGPEEYMPQNPDPIERAKRIRYGVYEVC